MEKGWLKRLVGYRVHLHPAALASDGQAIDAEWVISVASDTTFMIDLVARGCSVMLDVDDVRGFVKNPERERPGVRCGSLELAVQLSVSGNQVVVERIQSLPG